MSQFRQAFAGRVYSGRLGPWFRVGILVVILLATAGALVEVFESGFIASGSLPSLILYAGLLAQVSSDSFQEKALSIAVGLRMFGVIMICSCPVWLFLFGGLPPVPSLLILWGVLAIYFLIYAHQRDAKIRE